uniref:Uncharacterized protein n=2 Tax=Cacopsylla melanoneura TaxID=428564 RepID=A0A8D8QTF3_9HEMI
MCHAILIFSVLTLFINPEVHFNRSISLRNFQDKLMETKIQMPIIKIIKKTTKNHKEIKNKNKKYKNSLSSVLAAPGTLPLVYPESQYHNLFVFWGTGATPLFTHR